MTNNSALIRERGFPCPFITASLSINEVVVLLAIEVMFPILVPTRNGNHDMLRQEEKEKDKMKQNTARAAKIESNRPILSSLA